MRNVLSQSLPTLIWVTTGLSMVISCLVGFWLMGQRIPMVNNTWIILLGVFLLVLGVALSLVFAGFCFQILDIRQFTKHAALTLHRQAPR